MSNERKTLDDTATILEESARQSDSRDVLGDAGRLAAIHELEIVDEKAERSLQVIVQLATKLLDSPVSLISVVLEDRQFFAADFGLEKEWAERRETPISHSFCRHVVDSNTPFIVSDARTHPMVMENLAVEALGVTAYLGVPLRINNDQPIGALCVIDSAPRNWTAEDLEQLEKLSLLTCAEIGIRKEAILEQRRLQRELRQAQKTEALGQCVVGIAHDFNNVLGAVQGTIELLERKQIRSESTVDEVQQIKHTVGSAKKLVGRLIQWGRPGAQMQTQSLSTIVREALPVLKACISSAVRVDFNCDVSDEETLVLADDSEILQLLLNLCTNADYAMRSVNGELNGELNIAVSRSVEPESQSEFVELHVADNGIGIPASLLDRIHDPYFTTKPINEGSGLGLWTVFGIAKGHNAEVVVDSTANVGSRFVVRFPAAEGTECELRRDLETCAVQTSSPVGKAKVLLVDDNEVIANSMTRLLQYEGYEAVCCIDPLNALQVFSENPQDYDVVVSDRSMPNLSGESLLAAVKAANPAVVTILCSATLPDQLHGPREEVADAFCLKPWTIEDMNATIADLLLRRKKSESA